MKISRKDQQPPGRPVSAIETEKKKNFKVPGVEPDLVKKIVDSVLSTKPNVSFDDIGSSFSRSRIVPINYAHRCFRWFERSEICFTRSSDSATFATRSKKKTKVFDWTLLKNYKIRFSLDFEHQLKEFYSSDHLETVKQCWRRRLPPKLKRISSMSQRPI